MSTPAIEGPLSDRCAAYYDLLLRNSRHREQTRAILEHETNARFLYYDNGRPLCRSLRPYFIDETTYRRAVLAASKVGRGIGIVALKLAERPRLRALARLPKDIAAVLERDFKILESALVGRLDGFLDARGQIHFVEYNTDPHGVQSTHQLCDLFAEMPIMQLVERRFSARAIPVLKEARRAYETMHRRVGGRGAPRVMGFFDTSTFSDDTLRKFMLFPDLLTLVTASSQFVSKNGEIFVNGRRMDILENLNVGQLHRVLPNHPLVKAVRNGKLVMPDGILGSLLRGSRASFALLSDEENASWFPSDIRQAIRKHVPWTRILGDVKSNYRGEQIELVPMVRKNKDRLVLKYDGSYGGKQVVLGWRVDQRAWSHAIKTALRAGHWIVQERVDIPIHTFPVFAEGRVVRQKLYCDFNPFLFNGERAAGALVRVAGRDLLNITSGGSQLPVFVVSARERR